MQHLPGFIENSQALKDKGVDLVACISVNDPFVMLSWLGSFKNLNKIAKVNKISLQKGDVIKTHADKKLISKEVKYKSNVKIKEGIKNFIDWYKDYYNFN